MINNASLDDIRKLVGEIFAARRKSLDLTQEDLAKKSGVSLRTILGVESGKFYMRFDIMLRIIDALDLSFFFEEKESNKDLAVIMRERWVKLHQN